MYHSCLAPGNRCEDKVHRGRRKAAIDPHGESSELSARKRRISRWYRKPQFAAVMLVLLLIGGISIYRALSMGTAPVSWKSRGRPTRMPLGVYPAAAQAQATQAFGSWRGAPGRCGGSLAGSRTGADFMQVNSFYTTWARQPYTKAFGIPLFPEDVGATVGACIAGSYDGYWRTFADTMNSTGLLPKARSSGLAGSSTRPRNGAARHSSPPASGRSRALSARSLLVWSGTGMSTAVPAARCQATAF